MKTRIFVVITMMMVFSLFNLKGQSLAPSSMRISKEVLKDFMYRQIRGTTASNARRAANAQKYIDRIKEEIRKRSESKSDVNAISGGFAANKNDYQYGGYPVSCFIGTNTSSSRQVIIIEASREGAFSSFYGDKVEKYTMILQPGESFYFGRNNNWEWVHGNKMTIYDKDGKSVYWEYGR